MNLEVSFGLLEKELLQYTIVMIKRELKMFLKLQKSKNKPKEYRDINGTAWLTKLIKNFLLLKFSLAMIVASPISYASNFHEEITCLATNIYWEARNQTVQGMIAVGNVTRNRVKRDTFPGTYCEVVYEAKMSKWWKTEHDKDVPVRNRCQFSWFCDGLSDKIPTYDKEVWEVSLYLAKGIYNGRYTDNTFGATHYHAYYVSPKWAKQFRHTATIDDHIFYRYD